MSDHPTLPPPPSQPCTVLQKSLFHASVNTSISMSLVLIDDEHYKYTHTNAIGISVYALLSQEDFDIKMVIRKNFKDLALTYVPLEYFILWTPTCFPPSMMQKGWRGFGCLNRASFKRWGYCELIIHLELNVSFQGLPILKEQLHLEIIIYSPSYCSTHVQCYFSVKYKRRKPLQRESSQPFQIQWQFFYTCFSLM